MRLTMSIVNMTFIKLRMQEILSLNVYVLFLLHSAMWHSHEHYNVISYYFKK